MLELHSSRRRIIISATILIVTGGVVLAARSLVNRSKAQISQQIPPIALAHVPTGVPIVLTNLSIVKDDEPNGKKPFLKEFIFRAAALEGNNLTSLNFTVFEFNSNGNLRRVSSFVRDQEEVRHGAIEISLPLSRRSQPDHRLILTVDRVADGARNWEVTAFFT